MARRPVFSFGSPCPWGRWPSHRSCQCGLRPALTHERRGYRCRRLAVSTDRRGRYSPIGRGLSGLSSEELEVEQERPAVDVGQSSCARSSKGVFAQADGHRCPARPGLQDEPDERAADVSDALDRETSLCPGLRASERTIKTSNPSSQIASRSLSPNRASDTSRKTALAPARQRPPAEPKGHHVSPDQPGGLPRTGRRSRPDGATGPTSARAPRTSGGVGRDCVPAHERRPGPRSVFPAEAVAGLVSAGAAWLPPLGTLAAADRGAPSPLKSMTMGSGRVGRRRWSTGVRGLTTPNPMSQELEPSSRPSGPTESLALSSSRRPPLRP